MARGPQASFPDIGDYTFILAGAQQLDGATPAPAGIVVQRGDILCADMDASFELGVDCDGAPGADNCESAPALDLQSIYDLANAPLPFNLQDAGTNNGVLMIKARSDPVTPMPGVCTDANADANGTLCTLNNDTLGICTAGTCTLLP